ncbi:hypothetical protein HPP92_020781 [Vanilla planifolia]|uniref:Uncharacterized protein n=1 Tax=Vanilla planifolia TaxID=51239 RepID=A0A835PXP0_VANPL|nr:hypothetical protein HPP92_020781 [Vanilla planifolia]
MKELTWNRQRRNCLCLGSGIRCFPSPDTTSLSRDSSPRRRMRVASCRCSRQGGFDVAASA